MLNINDLWIGERLKIINREIIGTFEGKINDHTILLKVEDQMLQVSKEMVEMAPEETIEQKLIFNDYTPALGTSNSNLTNSQIDLHIEKLDPGLAHERSERIFLRQITAFENFMQEAIKYRLPHLIIIHGKGEGILKQEIRTMLNSKYKAKIILPIHQDGATEVWM